MTVMNALRRGAEAAADFLTNSTNETLRLARRRSTRELIAEIELGNIRAREIDREVSDLDAQADRAADRHSAVCLPAQDELKQIAAQITSAMADRVPIPEGLEDRRKELLGIVSAANKELEIEIAAIDALKKPLRQEAEPLRMTSGKFQVLQNQLRGDELGNPQLVAGRFACDQAVKWAQLRAEAARDYVNKLEAAIGLEKTPRQQVMTQHNTDRNGRIVTDARDHGAIATYQGRLMRWRAEESAAGDALVAAQRELNRVLDELLDE